jgi:hypothetical protein
VSDVFYCVQIHCGMSSDFQSQVKMQVRTTIPAAGTETTDLSNPGVCYVIRTHESFSRIFMTLPVPRI